jgi:hypothetical protein
MREKRNQDQFSNERRTPEEALSKGSTEPAPIDADEGFARRAGEVIARAVRATGGAKRK